MCVVLGGCSQTVEMNQADADRVEQAKAIRAEMEAGCSAEGYTYGTTEFQSCVGRASLEYTNAGVSEAKVLHEGIKRAPGTIKVANTGLQFARIAGVISDSRVKRGIVRVGMLENGIYLYRFSYVWGSEQFVGVLAQEVQKVVPTAVYIDSEHFLRVDYQKLGITMMTWDEWRSSTAATKFAPPETAVFEWR
jgi:hypothetical protein